MKKSLLIFIIAALLLSCTPVHAIYDTSSGSTKTVQFPEEDDTWYSSLGDSNFSQVGDYVVGGRDLKKGVRGFTLVTGVRLHLVLAENTLVSGSFIRMHFGLATPWSFLFYGLKSENPYRLRIYDINIEHGKNVYDFEHHWSTDSLPGLISLTGEYIMIYLVVETRLDSGEYITIDTEESTVTLIGIWE